MAMRVAAVRPRGPPGRMRLAASVLAGAIWRMGLGDAAPRVAEVGDDLEFSAEGADVFGEGGQFGDGAVLDGGDALLGHAHGPGDLGLRQAGVLAHLGQVLGAYLERPLPAGFLHCGAVVRMDELVHELLAGVAGELPVLAPWRTIPLTL
jgi:hypothetical protein